MGFDFSKGKKAGENKEGSSSLTFIRAKDLLENGKTGQVVLEGIYEGAVPNKLTEKEDFKFTTEDGNTVIVNSTGHLAYLMRDVSPGNACQITYLGKEKYKKDAPASHKFEVVYC
jgi:hypothetical protein